MRHYTYLLIDPDSEMMYIGVRSFNGNPNKDPYMGSSKVMTTEDKLRCDKIILKTFSTRKEAMQHEIKLHELYDVAHNDKFWNACKATSVGFDVTGCRGRKFTSEQCERLSKARQGEGNNTYRLTTEYEWVHKSGEVFRGTTDKVVKHSGKDNSSFYKVLRGQLLYASGWRIRKNLTSGVETSNFDEHYRKPRDRQTLARCNMAVAKANITARKYNDSYTFASTKGKLFIGTMYALSNKYNVSHSLLFRVLKGQRNAASGWRIVANSRSKCQSTNLNYGRCIKVKLTNLEV